MSQRQLIRQQLRTMRRDLAPDYQLASADQLVSQFTQHPLICHAKRVALYLASDGELDTRPVIEWCWSRGIAVCLPVLHPFSKGHLLFVDFQADTPMSSNRFGIAEPELNCQTIIVKSAIDIVFTPLVAFDANGNLWASDYWNNRIIVIKTADLDTASAPFRSFYTNSIAWTVGGGNDNLFAPLQAKTITTAFSQPEGIAFDSTGRLWVANNNDSAANEAPTLVYLSVPQQNSILALTPNTSINADPNMTNSINGFGIYNLPTANS